MTRKRAAVYRRQPGRQRRTATRQLQESSPTKGKGARTPTVAPVITLTPENAATSTPGENAATARPTRAQQAMTLPPQQAQTMAPSAPRPQQTQPPQPAQSPQTSSTTTTTAQVTVSYQIGIDNGANLKAATGFVTEYVSHLETATLALSTNVASEDTATR